MEKVKFIIWFEGRSGSSHLVSLMNSHSKILCRGENFDASLIRASDEPVDFATVNWEGKTFGRRLATFDKTVFGPTDTDVLEHLNALFNWKKQANGFKFKHSRQSYLYPEVCDALIRQKDEVKVIHLVRKNIVKRAISKQNQQRIREVQGRANLSSPVELGKIVVDVAAVLEYCQRLTGRQERFMQWPQNFEQVIKVEYEDLLHHPEIQLNRVFEFLGVPKEEVTSKIFKATPDKISDAVHNFEELALALRGTGFEKHLS